jgi:hypothetical protein
MNYWWDFCPRLVHQGIWDDVYLVFPGPMRIADVFVRPRLSDDFTRADVAGSGRVGFSGRAIGRKDRPHPRPPLLNGTNRSSEEGGRMGAERSHHDPTNPRQNQLPDRSRRA